MDVRQQCAESADKRWSIGGGTMRTEMSRRSTHVDVYGGVDPGDLPCYPLPEVAHFLWTARAKLGRWACGYTHDGKREPPVIQIADRANRLLSFNNLSELHVLSALRGHEVSLQRIRGAVRTLREQFVGDHPHPLLALDMQTDGLSIFIEHLGHLVNITRYGQGALREVFEAHLKRIERDPNKGTALRLFPFVRPPLDVEHPVEQPRPVSIDPRVSFGRPVLAGTGIPTVELAHRFSAGESMASLAEDLSLEPEIIEEAIRYQLAERAA